MDRPSNRTHPLFTGTTNTNSVNVGITTDCTMHCPNCSIDVPNLKRTDEARHIKIADLFGDGLIMVAYEKLRRVHLTGGEPTMHPHFEYIADEIQRWWRCEFLTLETNGTLWKKHADVIDRCFDMVFITHYIKDKIYPNNFDNTAIIEEAEKRLGSRLIREEPVVHSKQHLTLGMLRDDVLNTVVNDKMEADACTKWHDPGLPSGYYDRLLYPCCVSFGIDRELGIPVEKNWREKIGNMVKGCHRCLYRGT